MKRTRCTAASTLWLIINASCAGGGVSADAITHKDAQEVHRLLVDELGEAGAAADFKEKCQQVFR